VVFVAGFGATPFAGRSVLHLVSLAACEAVVLEASLLLSKNM